MPAYSEGAEGEIRARIRRLIAIHPGISTRRIAEVLKLNFEYVLKLKNKIHTENIKSIEKTTSTYELAEIKNFWEAVLPEITGIIFSQDEFDKDGKLIKAGAKNGDKIRALTALLNGKVQMMDLKFDAGVYERQLGKLKNEETMSPGELAIINQALEHVRIKRTTKRENNKKPKTPKRIGK